MLNNRNIKVLIITGVILGLVSCQTNTYMIPAAYDTPYKEIQTDPYGKWAEINTNNLAFGVSGELLCVDHDTVFVLVDDYHMRKIYLPKVTGYKIFTHKSQSGRYGKFVLFYSIPPILGALINAGEFFGEFISLAFPVATVGLVHAIIEGNSQKNVLQGDDYQDLFNYRIYARYPTGKPEGIDLGQLTQKKEE